MYMNIAYNAIEILIAIIKKKKKKKSLIQFLIIVEKSFTEEKFYLRKSGG